VVNLEDEAEMKSDSGKLISDYSNSDIYAEDKFDPESLISRNQN